MNESAPSFPAVEALYRQIRVPAKVISRWTEFTYDETEAVDVPHLYCQLEDGRVYQSIKTEEGRQWALHTPAVPDR